ncbi:hypothetical protein KAR10_01460, partial [bacterium]|nr:hypothetical protein [bacterium]
MFLKPKGGDKPLTPDGRVDAIAPAEIMILYKPGIVSEADSSLHLSDYEIEDLRGRADYSGRVNFIREMILEFPHDTTISDERGDISLSHDAETAIQGTKMAIDKLIDPQRDIPLEERLALINTLAGVLRYKQAKERLVRDDVNAASDLIWYLKQRLNETGSLLGKLREEGAVLVPNKQQWAPLMGKANVILLDEELFEFKPD